MKVYIWEISGNYGAGMAVAVAENVKQARKLAREQAGNSECGDICNRPKVLTLDKCKPQAFYVYCDG